MMRLRILVLITISTLLSIMLFGCTHEQFYLYTPDSSTNIQDVQDTTVDAENDAADCGNTQTDPTNCGVCGNRCVFSCVAGECTEIQRLSSGGRHTFAFFSDGTLRGWGANDFGQVGTGSTADQLSPVEISALSGIKQIAGGFSHTCFLSANDSLFCWGANLYGQLGDGTSVSRIAPQLSAPVLTATVQIAVGAAHNCARAADGTLQCWGWNDFGQLGDNSTTNRPLPVPVGGLRRVLHVSAGERHTCALLDDGRVMCWGRNAAGQIGDGTMDNRTVPTDVLSLSQVAEIGVGRNHSCARLLSGEVQCWGASVSGTLTTPTPVGTLNDAIQLGVGGGRACALRRNNTVVCWGSGPLGDGTMLNNPEPVPVTGLSNVAEIRCGDSHVCARLMDNSVYCWGDNQHGQLGDGTTNTRLVPTRVMW